jgi:hypothetical protein
MRLIRVCAAIAVLGLAACATTQSETASQGGSPMIDVPTAPFPYNSKFCT